MVIINITENHDMVTPQLRPILALQRVDERQQAAQ